MQPQNILDINAYRQPNPYGDLLSNVEGEDFTAKIFEFQEYEYLRTRVNRKTRRKSKGKAKQMDYLPIDTTKIMSDFPTNKKYGLNNWAKVRTIMDGEDELVWADLSMLEKPDPEGKKITTPEGEEIPAMVKVYTPIQVTYMMLPRFIVDWSFTDKNGKKYDISYENIKTMHRKDFDYIAEWFNAMVIEFNKEDLEETDPKQGLTEEEKNELPSGLEEENTSSENAPEESLG